MERAGLRVLMFTDIEGSTALLQRLGPQYVELIARYDALVRASVEQRGGTVVGAEGDGYFLTFESANDGLDAALDMQLAVGEQTWPQQSEVRVRMGLHVGDVLETSTGLVGLAIHHAARIAAAAHGGQVLVSDAARSLLDGSSDRAELRPLGVHGLRDVGETPLFQLLHPSLRDQFPPPRSTRGVRSNLPAPRTSMVGRVDERAAVAALLGVHRLVTLVGAGGCGKTRLAVRVASESGDAFPDGVWLVELAALSDPAGVPATIAAAIGATTGAVTTAGLIAGLRERRVLIVLDNCEHLLDACAAFIADVLVHCPYVAVLTASREPIGATGEAVYRVPSLALAPLSASAAEVRAVDSARLFEQRVGLVRPGYVIGEAEAAAVAEICRRLDGLPLAIELAAARCRLLAPVELAARLDDRFRILTGGARDALPRQQTLLATIDWSYRLLSEAEQVLLARLAVFHGGASLDAVENVCEGEPVAVVDVLALVGSLVDKSLLVLDESVAGSVRVRLPETIRQYAADKFVDRPEAAALRDGHAEWFGSLFGPLAIGPWERTKTERVALARADQDNFAAALDWATAAGSADSLRVITILAHFHPELRDPNHFGDRIRAALDAVPDAPAALRANALARLGWYLYERNPADPVAVEVSEQALTLARESGDLRILSEVAMWAGFTTDDTELGLEAVAAADASGDVERAVHLRLEAAKFCDFDACFAIVDDADSLARRHGLDSYRAGIACNRAELESHRGNGAAALSAMDDALAFDEVASAATRFGTRTWGAIVLADQGRFVEAEALLADALALLSRTPTGLLETEARGACAHLARLRGDTASARIDAYAALDAEHHYVRWTDGLALLALAAADRRDGHPAAAIAFLLPVLSERGRGRDTSCQAIEGLAACLVDLDQLADAARVLAAADAWRVAHGAPLPPARKPFVDGLRTQLGPAEPLSGDDLLALARKSAAG